MHTPPLAGFPAQQSRKNIPTVNMNTRYRQFSLNLVAVTNLETLAGA